MTTNLKPGLKIRIAVPLDPSDNTPFSKRKDHRLSRIEDITEQGIIHEGEGSVRADRIDIDWELVSEEEEKASGLTVVKMNSGPVLASFVRVSATMAEMYSEQTTPPGLIVIPVRDCGKSWDWLRGRTAGEAFKGLSLVFEPNAPKAGFSTCEDQSEAGQAAPQSQRTGRKRGPKPRTPIPTCETEILPAAPGPAPTVSASDGKISFKHRMRLWNAATVLVLHLEAEADDLRIGDALAELQDVMNDIRGKA